MDHYPLSDDDGAARILDPIIQYYNDMSLNPLGLVRPSISKKGGTPLDKKCVKLRNFEPTKW